MTQHEPTPRRAADPTSLAIAGATTLAWYAVPDVVRPRWARALLKTAIGATGAVLTVAATTEGKQAQDAVRTLRDTVRSDRAATRADDDGAGRAETGAPDDATDDEVREHNTFVAETDASPALPAPPVVLAAVGAAAVGASTALVVAGERWVYRRGEALRRRGVRAPHTRVGLAMAAVAVALAAAEPFLGKDEDAEPVV